MAAEVKRAPLTECEIKIDGVWCTVAVEQAWLKPEGARLRCLVCHGPVVVHGAYSPGRRAFLQHRKSHDGCPFNAKGYSGTASPHPEALA